MSFFPGKRGSYHFTADGKFYDPDRGHTGEDYLMPVNTPVPCPCEGEVLEYRNQKQMGNVLYVRDLAGAVHVFAHLNASKVKKGDKVKRGDIIALSGNTGTATDTPHVHYEIIFESPWKGYENMVRNELSPYKGYNIPPEEYLRKLEELHQMTTEIGYLQKGAQWLADQKLTQTLRDGQSGVSFGELGIILERFLSLTKNP